jgi:hypothetical protein
LKGVKPLFQNVINNQVALREFVDEELVSKAAPPAVNDKPGHLLYLLALLATGKLVKFASEASEKGAVALLGKEQR